MYAYERLIRYAEIDTASDPDSLSCPSTAKQLTLAKLLVRELKELGLADAKVDENGYVTAHLAAAENAGGAPALGFIAHMDTSPDAPGAGVKVQLHPDYDGKSLALSGGKMLTLEDFPHLSACCGKTLLTSDGTTLLGADDKAGIAEIMTALEWMQQEKTPHPALCIGFTPDEEIGRGADLFPLEAFGAKYAYTVDGGEVPALEYETFHAASAVLTFTGVSVHPGYAKGIMKNAALLAAEFTSLLPQDETPATTEGRQGFYHLHGMKGNVEQATLSYLVRDHDKELFEQRKKTVEYLAKQFNRRYGEGTVSARITDSYYNMAEKILPVRFLVDDAMQAARELGLSPRTEAVRGGTDGSKLSFMGLPCPNLPTGGYAFHGPYEHITAEDMEICARLIQEIARLAVDWK